MRILISAPYFLPVVEHYRSQLEAEGMELVIADVRERLSEQELLPLVPSIRGAICGDDEFTERVLQAAPHLKVISKWGKIAGAALDVFESEPLPDDSPLRRMNHYLLAPHNANSGLAAKKRVHESTIRILLTGLKQAS